jgi:hypothetical protein
MTTRLYRHLDIWRVDYDYKHLYCRFEFNHFVEAMACVQLYSYEYDSMPDLIIDKKPYYHLYDMVYDDFILMELIHNNQLL